MKAVKIALDYNWK